MTYHAEDPISILKEFNSSPKGLTKNQIEEHRAKYGSNTLSSKKKKPVYVLILEQFKEPMTIILLVAAIFGFVSTACGWGDDDSPVSIEGIVLIVILAINSIITVIQELKTTSALDALKKMTAPTCRVIRDGVEEKIPSTDLVVGDVIYLDDGCVVPADLRLFDCAALKVDESSLTGESVPVEKNSDIKLSAKALLADRINMAYSSTIVTNGKGFGIVTAVGRQTEVGKIAQLLDDTDQQEIPLKHKLNTVCKCLTLVGAIVCVIVIAISLIGDINSWTKAIFLGISLAVSVIPEGLPATSTIVMAVGVQKMAKHNALVKQLASVETLGSVNVICSDKTGTLTQNKMEIKHVYSGYTEVELAQYSSDKYRELMMAGVYCNNAYLEKNDELLGDPTEGSFLMLAKKYLKSWKSAREKNQKIEELPFDSIRKCMTTVHKIDGKMVAYTKGSIESIIGKCTTIMINGEVRKITDKDKKAILALVDELAVKALRTLGLAKNTKFTDYLQAENDMTWLGLVAMFDPPREEVKETIAKCHRAGIRVIMITGDHPSTARAVAEYVGICQPKEKVLDGSHLAKLKFNQLCNEVKTVNVFARVSPTDKINIVKALQHNGQVVSMTGDGVNDSPSLKMADVGVAMGITGTDVAKDAADMILLDDDFNTIEKAIEEGRRIYNNIQKVIAFLVSGNVAEILIILVAAIFTDVFNPTPLTAILILFVNLLTDTIPGIALGLDKASPNLMEYPPIGKKDFLNKKSIFQIIYYGVILAVIALGAFVLGKYAINFGSDEHLIAFTFATLSFTEMALIFCFKSSSISIFSRHLKYNPWIFYSAIISVVLTVLIIMVPGVNGIFSMKALSWVEWMYVLGFSLIPIIIAEITKTIKRFKKNRRKRLAAVAASIAEA